MKKYGLLILLFIASSAVLQAQMHFGFFGMHGSSVQSPYRSWGGGMSMLSGTLTNDVFPFRAQLGGGYYVAGAGNNSVTNASRDETSTVSFSNMQVGVFGLARFTGKSETARRVPYVDLFGGVQNNSSSMSTHYGPKNHHHDCTSESLNSSTGFSAGAGAGVLFRLSNSTFLDVGLQWQSSAANGKFVNMKSIVNSGDGISYQTQKIPAGMLMLKIGLQIRTNNDGCRCGESCKVQSHHAKTCYLGGGEK